MWISQDFWVHRYYFLHNCTRLLYIVYIFVRSLSVTLSILFFKSWRDVKTHIAPFCLINKIWRKEILVEKVHSIVDGVHQVINGDKSKWETWRYFKMKDLHMCRLLECLMCILLQRKSINYHIKIALIPSPSLNMPEFMNMQRLFQIITRKMSSTSRKVLSVLSH